MYLCVFTLGLSVHPVLTNLFSFSTSAGKFAVFDVESCSTVVGYTSSSTFGGFNCLSFHPDGAMVAVGTDSGNVLLFQITDETGET
jgi:hypothetical protein